MNSEFSAALTWSLEDFIHKSLKDEQIECIRRIVYFEKDVLAVLPTGDRELRHCLRQCNLRSGVLFFRGSRRKCGSARVGGREKEKKPRLIQLLQKSSTASLIGRKTKDFLSHVPIGYMIAFLTSGVF